MTARAATGVLLIAVSLLAVVHGQSSDNRTITVSGYGNEQALSDTAAVRARAPGVLREANAPMRARQLL